MIEMVEEGEEEEPEQSKAMLLNIEPMKRMEFSEQHTVTTEK